MSPTNSRSEWRLNKVLPLLVSHSQNKKQPFQIGTVVNIEPAEEQPVAEVNAIKQAGNRAKLYIRLFIEYLLISNIHL